MKAKNIINHALTALLVVFATGVLPVSAQNDATNRPPVQTFYLPIPEEDLLEALTVIHGGANWTLPAEPIESYNSIVVFVDGTVIYYDQWENGYERDIANPNHLYSSANPAGTQIWGDGDPANGFPPGYPNDKLYAGNVILLSSEVKVNGRDPSKQVFFDGADKIGVSRPVAITRAVWASQTKTLFAGANEVYDTTFFGDEFVIPVGEDTADQNEIFQYTGMSIMAGPEGATIQIDKNADGIYEETITLAEGQAYLVNGGLKQGASIHATSGSVQVNLLTGDIYDGYESRFITLLPTRLWSSAYTSPVATPVTTKSGNTTYSSGTKIWLYNPGSSAITVYYETADASAKSVSVPAGSSTFIIAGKKTTTNATGTYTGSTTSGVYVYTKDGSPFYAIATIDSTGTGTSTLKSPGGDNRTWDWGFALVPDGSMSSQIVVGLGLGRDPTSTTSPNENGAPIWTVADKDTTLYVDYDGNPDTGAYTDANGSKYDKAYNVNRLEIAKVYNPSGDQTGMLIYTLNGAKIAAAWGEDPATASPGQPGLDLGTGIPPMPEWVMRKSSKLVVDADEDGFMTPGDTIEYHIEFQNVGRQPVSGLTLKDELPADVTYVANSSDFTSTLRGYPNGSHDIADNASGDAFPFGGAGLDLSDEANSENGGNLAVGGVWVYTYRVQINKLVTSDSIHNIAIAVGPGGSVTNAITDSLRALVGDTVWLDEDGDGIQDAGETPLAGIIVSLVDTNGNLVFNDKDLPYQVATDANGHYLFKGVRPGIYKVVLDLPPYYTATEKDAGSDDDADSDIDATGATAAFTLRGGEGRLDIDAGVVLVDAPASIQIVKLAGAAADGTVLALDTKGDTVTYSYKVTNTGLTYLKDVTVTDDKLGAVGIVEGLLAPGATVILTKDATITADVINVGTVVGTPCAKDGTAITFLTDVTDDDDAEVTAPADPVPADPAVIGDRVWNDADGDGIQDDGELGIYGVTVNLLNAEGNVIATTTTDANGNYRFEIGDPGTYVVEFVPSSSWIFTTKDVGDNDALDSDADPVTGRTPPFTVSAGQTDLTLDAGLVGGVPPGFCSLIDVANKFNAFIGGNFTANGGDTEGNLLVRGNATLSAGYSVGLIGPGYGRTRAAAALGTDTLVVGGDLTETTAPDMNGNIVYGGNYTNLGTNANRMLAFYDKRHVAPVTLDAANNVPEDGSGRALADIAADLRLFSSIVAALPESEGVVKDYETDPWNIVWKGTNTFRNVFWVDAADFSLANKGIWFDVPAGSKIVVNIFGATVTETNSDIYLPAGVDPTLVLFNFVDTTSITTTGFEFHGSVLAPYADANFSGASIDGFAYIGGNVQTSSGFEFHDYELKAFDCSRSIVTVNKPSVQVILTANGYKAGAVVRAEQGGTLEVVETVVNNGRTSLKDVIFVDILGNRYDLGTLAAGESKSVTVSTAAAAGSLSATASADVIAADGSAVQAYEGARVSAAGNLSVQTLTTEAFAAYEAAEAVAEAAKLGYIPRPDFEVVAINFVNEAPTITGEVFSVVAKIKNVGETAAYPGKVAFYLSHAEIVEIGETPYAVKDTTQSLEPGQEMEIKFKNVKAPSQGGPHHVRVLVDADNAVDELSEGNNQLPLFYFLNNITVAIEINNGQLTLTWDSYEGQAYTVLGANTLDAFEEYIPVDGEGNEDRSFCRMEATPPFNTVTIDLDGAGARFFKIRVDNLANEVR